LESYPVPVMSGDLRGTAIQQEAGRIEARTEANSINLKEAAACKGRGLIGDGVNDAARADDRRRQPGERLFRHFS
jgi:hypothetical protein